MSLHVTTAMCDCPSRSSVLGTENQNVVEKWKFAKENFVNPIRNFPILSNHSSAYYICKKYWKTPEMMTKFVFTISSSCW